jgi:transcription-repair coupling factor (superfamily II helicase)
MWRRSAPAPNDPLYEAVSEGRRHPGMEHWLPLLHRKLDTLFDYVPGAAVALEPLAEDAAHERFAQIADYYKRAAGARRRPRRHDLQAARAGRLYLTRRAVEGSPRGRRAGGASRPSPIRMPAAVDARDASGPQLRARNATRPRPTSSTR